MSEGDSVSKSARVFLVALMVAPLAAVLSPASSSAAGTTVTTNVRVATWNVQVRRTVSEFTRGVVPLAARSDLIGLQEVDTRDKEHVLAGLADSGWSYYRAKPALQMPVLWRHDRFSLAGARVAQISGATYIGNEAPGMKASQHARYASVVRLVDKVTGRRVSVVNAHLVSGAVRGGRPWVGRPRLFGLYRTGLANLTALAARERAWGRVFVLGDFNAGWVADRKWLRRRLPIRAMGGIGFQSMWAAARPSNGLGTRNDALIDQVYTNMRPLGSRVQFDLSGLSDHRPAVALYPAP
ncbi:MAG TPA: endonuclease/exonuclease/phosphatase family protein [Marmoricola sp.]